MNFLYQKVIDVYLISGATGLVGSALIKSLAVDGPVIGLSRSPSSGKPYKFIECDIRQSVPDLEESEGAVVIHCAAEIRSSNWDDHWHGNVIATKNLLDWAVRHKAKRVIFLSSGAVYGDTQGKKARESDLATPSGNYALSKYLAEELCRSYEKLFSLPVVIHRLYFPFDVNQRSGVFGFLYNSIRNRNPIRLNVNGSPDMSITAVEDVVSAIKFSSNDSFAPGIYNLCGDEVLNVEEIAHLMEAVCEKSAVIESTGLSVQAITADNTKLKSAGWQPEFLFADYLAKLKFLNASAPVRN